MTADSGSTRRRGAALEADILDAVWEELAAVGYARLTMEGVAARARTGKQVLYRRWPNRAQLVKAALPHRFGTIVDQVPDTGELRADVLGVLRLMAERQRDMGSDVVVGLLGEAPELDPTTFGIMQDVTRTLLERAAKRGEIATADLPARVITVPAALLRYEMMLSRTSIEDHVLVEIVDEVFLPLVGRADTPEARTSGGDGTGL
ncbi:TetR/AcrR family transcriptional regulator [Streptomyces pseudovenezuelae]|uniref:AcrR family transcriptional regulator n=1 Tax=Streptomyces pseudovenezuelae TaxID=67350 RepID=A0ABT6LU68_9ACTN|nr:TetR/AcrR family transcriptional regulator [Streptomyces pseudovenezuelae]MDH6219860.1 AcrR family transcriptional regulator [Streptomyces pseudovenezuelae]